MPGQEDLAFHPELVEGDFRVMGAWLSFASVTTSFYEGLFLKLSYQGS